MTGFPEIKSALQEMSKAHDAFFDRTRQTLDEHGAAISDLRDRIEIGEAKASSRLLPPASARNFTDKDAREHRDRFEKWMRSPGDSDLKNQLGEFESKMRQTKAMTIGSNADGGFAVPEEIAREVERLELELSPVRRLVKVMRVGSNDNKHLVNIRGATSGWVGESGTRSATSTPQLRERAPTMGELYAYPQGSEWALDDVFFNVATWLAEEVAQEFAEQEGSAVISGNGTNKPTGMLNTTPVATDDFASPMRAADAYEFIASLTDSSPAVAEVMPDALIDLVYTVNAAYRARSSWTMNSATAGAVRKLKDSQGRYLWTDGLAAGQPALLLGYPVEIWEQMPDIGTDAFPVAFGDFRRDYLLVDRTELRILQDPYTSPGHVKFYVRRREGGCVLNGDAVKFLRTTIA